jgi:hypothetical protein
VVDWADTALRAQPACATPLGSSTL